MGSQVPGLTASWQAKQHACKQDSPRHSATIQGLRPREERSPSIDSYLQCEDHHDGGWSIDQLAVALGLCSRSGPGRTDPEHSEGNQGAKG